MQLVDYRHSNVRVQRVRHLLAYAMSDPTEDRLSQVMDTIYSDIHAKLLVLVDIGMTLGLIGITRIGLATAHIRHIAVETHARNQGMGSKMVDELLRVEHLTEVVAETDKDAVGFYHKYGFHVQSLGEKYPGIERFLCTLRKIS